ncbi:DUF1566 domain-containing protein [bacterium]|nr:DUF1566 domain-containing protein [bacterium]MBU1994927.1 DUF1566 domain-containing protein [bacterium]
MKAILLIFILIFFSACQQGASSNKDLSSCDQNAFLKYPVKTAQTDTFVYEDITTQPSTFYYDDGYFNNRSGADRDFKNMADGTVYNANYNLYWQDNEVQLENNVSRAKDYCENLILAGKSDWRLPNIYELTTLLALNARDTLVDLSFNTVPEGFYYSSNEVQKTSKTYVVGFEQNKFSINKIDKEYDLNQTNPIYGVLVGVSQEPTYARDGYLLQILDKKTYFYFKTSVSTTISYIDTFDINGTLVSTDGPFIVQKIETKAPDVIQIQDSYIKCVSGAEVGGFNFSRDNKNGVVVDRATSLMWQDNSDVINKKYKWGEAVKYCSELNLAGYDDWRTPTISELLTIVDIGNNSTYAVNDTFLYKSANKFHSSSNLCFGENCSQKNLQLNACGYLDNLVTENLEVDVNPYDKITTEPYFKARCVRCGGYE